MEMTEKLEKLKELQDVLAERFEIENRLEEIPKTLDSSIESLDRFKRDYIQKNAEYEDKKQLISVLKLDLDDARRKREESEKGMDSVTTHREYEILEKQIEQAQEIEDAKSKEIQKEEMNLSELNDLLKNEEDLISSTEKDVNEQKENLDKEIASCNNQLKTLKDTEANLSEGIDAETIIKFQRIIKRNRQGIVAVKRNVCNGCHMVLPAQFANEVRHGNKILFCPYCSRILYYEDSPDKDENYYSLTDQGSAEEMDEDLIDDEDLVSDSGGERDGGVIPAKSSDYE